MSTGEQEERVVAVAAEKNSTDEEEQQQRHDHDDIAVTEDNIQQYMQNVIAPLRALVSRPREEINDKCIDDIRALLTPRLPDEVCEEGQEDLIAPLRAKLWSVLLLGLRPEDLNRFECSAESECVRLRGNLGWWLYLPCLPLL